jgi:septal ring factor EnvC (AmiA/AmiB activator)
MSIKKKYKCLINIDLDHKMHPEGSLIELSEIMAESLILAKAIAPAGIDEQSVEEMEAEELINKQHETIEILNKELENAFKARDELERALLQAKATIQSNEKAFESLQIENSDLRNKVTEMVSVIEELKKTATTEVIPVASNQPAVKHAPAKKVNTKETAAK